MRLLLLLLPCLCASCGIVAPYRPVAVETADQVFARAQAARAQGSEDDALVLLIRLRNTEGLDPVLRDQADEELQIAFQTQMQRRADDIDGLLDLYALGVPDRLRAAAGVRAAELMLAEGDRLRAFRTIQRIDDEMPFHPSRSTASEVVARAGMSLIQDDGRYRLILRYRTQGKAALEYLVLNYPSSPHCPAAYMELAGRYEEAGDIDEAVERCEDLLVYHPGTAEAVDAEARLPYLRMRRLQRDSYDRTELLDARREIDHWLGLHPGHELEPWMRELRAECFERLAKSDLIVARHYDRFGQGFGARIHAERALAEARVAGNTKVEAQALTLLERYPRAEPEATVSPEPATDGAL